MSILYNGDYRIIDLQRWHGWWPWAPIRLTVDQGYGLAKDAGPWRWLYAVERKLNYKETFGGDPTSYEPPYTYVWEYRDIGERNAEFGFEGLAAA